MTKFQTGTHTYRYSQCMYYFEQFSSFSSVRSSFFEYFFAFLSFAGKYVTGRMVRGREKVKKIQMKKSIHEIFQIFSHTNH